MSGTSRVYVCVWIDDNVCLLTHSEYASIVCVCVCARMQVCVQTWINHVQYVCEWCPVGERERRPHYLQRQEFLLSDVAREKGRRSREEGNRGCSSGPGWWSRIYDRRDTALDRFTGDSWLLEGV